MFRVGILIFGLLVCSGSGQGVGRFITDTIRAMTGAKENLYERQQHSSMVPRAAKLGNWQPGLPVPPNPNKKQKYNIGITISIRPNETSVWTNGAKQNAFFMYQSYTQNQHNVVLINLHSGTVNDATADWNLNGMPIIDFDTAIKRDLNVIIESGMQISPRELEFFQKRGIRVASFRTGNDYYMIAEETVFQRPTSTMFLTLKYDALWTLPSYDQIAQWQSLMFRSPVEFVPYVWSPFFHDPIASVSERAKYTPRLSAKSIVIMEPNLWINKNFVMPLAMVEGLYRTHPQLVREVLVLNAEQFPNNNYPAFDMFTNALDIVRDNRTQFLSRFRTPWFMGKYGDIVLSHQLHNSLNFLYFDALYAHYPLVHNSPYLKDCGYYYEGNNVTMAVEQLYLAVTTHDSNMHEYNRKADACLARFSVTHPDNVAGYERLVENLLSRPPRV
eukprot:m.25836 g.25836  ORF g.25836 m.25836 type:complete len:444 (-) comp8883_c0_seq2:52-1383(-)